MHSSKSSLSRIRSGLQSLIVSDGLNFPSFTMFYTVQIENCSLWPIICHLWPVIYELKLMATTLWTCPQTTPCLPHGLPHRQPHYFNGNTIHIFTNILTTTSGCHFGYRHSRAHPLIVWLNKLIKSCFGGRMWQIFFIPLVFAAVCSLSSLFSLLSAWCACKGYCAKETTKVILFSSVEKLA